MANNPESTVVCQTRRRDIENLMDHLRDLILTNENDGQNDWSDAGSLGHVRELLVQAVAFYGGLGSSDIESVLTEIRKI